ncbi:thioredoxin reductase (NADPH) [Nematocida sp. LUAm3]|nr:thioredoxin reductase (NADPH) [Nematocida sp. LUAm3]KAI5176128.1 thioredoxin reductase (NADPH) [Nematocida sp. LUAm2]KAI5179016.1 thioredoxin reductase (NADPH) [Nematocida sp. LUAm1]
MSLSVNRESVIIIGSGPAAYSASVYLKEHSPLVLSGNYSDPSQYPGGQLITTTGVDNYPGFIDIQGPELANAFKDHALSVGVRVKEIWVTEVSQEEEGFIVKTKEEGELRAKILIIATGSVAKRLYAKGCGDKELWQKGISACATCDGWLFTDQDIMVVGGGDTAMEEVLYLSQIAKSVTLIHRSDAFRARPDMLHKVKSLKNVQILVWKVLEEACGEEVLEEVVIKDVRTNEKEKIKVNGLFFAIGHTPSTSFLSNLPELLDENGYIITDKETMQTKIKGIYAAGDVQDFKYKQAITAAYSGMLAGVSASKDIRTYSTCIADNAAE